MSINLNAFFEADRCRCRCCKRAFLSIELRAGLCFDCRATEARARAVIEDTARGDFEHDPSDDCGCDRCATTRQELNERYDALCDAIDDGELVFERDRAVPHAGLYGDAQVFRGWVCLAGTPSNEACDPGEVA